MIVGVAIWNDVLTVKLPKPARHCDCFKYLADSKINGHKLGMSAAKNQGFYTHTGRILNREQAYKYARRHNQIINPEAKRYLFSEDIW